MKFKLLTISVLVFSLSALGRTYTKRSAVNDILPRTNEAEIVKTETTPTNTVVLGRCDPKNPHYDWIGCKLKAAANIPSK